MRFKLVAFVIGSLLLGAWSVGAALRDPGTHHPPERSRIDSPLAEPQHGPGAESDSQTPRLSDVGTDGALSPEPGDFMAEPEDLAAVEYLARPEDPNLVCFIPTVYGPIGACSSRDVPFPVPSPQHAPPP
jgi:hypothetical protein